MPPSHQKSKSSFGVSSGQVNKGEVLFKRRVQSISEYIDVLDSNPEEASRLENIWQKDFYKNELKVALTLNHNLVKILGEKQLQIKELFLQISQLQKKMPRVGQEKESFCRINVIQNENSQNEANKGNSTPKRQFKEAYQAERKILGAKHSQQKEEYQKLMERKEEILRSNKEENVYLLDKLLSLGEQLSSFQQENHGLKKQNKELRKSMKTEAKREDNCERKLNFSLISVDNEEEAGEKQVQEIFLSQIEISTKPGQKKLLKRQIESLKVTIQEQEQKGSQPQSQPSQKPKMKYYEALHQNFLQLQKELTEKEEEIVEYRAIFAEFNEHQHHFRRQSERSSILETEITILKKTIQEYEIKCSEQEFEAKQEEKWLECLKLQNANDNLTLELQTVSSSNTSLKVLLEKMYNLSQTQQKEWNLCFEDFGKGGQS